ncbi:hypothetical protein BLOT_012817 [Blomia tropicalis]|nr:hypothetical protein BLOT_012817 [Blomia tropicalis]
MFSHKIKTRMFKVVFIALSVTRTFHHFQMYFPWRLCLKENEYLSSNLLALVVLIANLGIDLN